MPEATIQPMGDPQPGEVRLRENADLRSRLRSVLDRERSQVQSDVVAALEEATGVPNRERIPLDAQTPQERSQGNESWNDRQDRLGYGDVRDMQDYLYQSLPAYAKRIRNPQVDFEIAEWLRALRWKRWEHLDRMSNKLNEQFGGKRATLTVGESELGAASPGPGTGAPFIPLPLANLIILARDKRAKIRARAQRFTSVSQSMKVPTSDTASAFMVGEGSTAAQGEPTPASKLLQKKKAQARFRATDEMLEDSAFNLVSYFAERGGSALGALEDVQFCTSTGLNDKDVTESLESATITAVTEQSAGVVKYIDVVALFFALPEQYRTSDVVWMGNSFMMQLLSTVVDLNGRPIFTPGLAAPTVVTSEAPDVGRVGAIFGHDVLELPLTEGTSPQSADLFCGILSNYGMLDGGGMRIRASEHTRWANDEVEWKITERFDGSVLLEDSFRKMEALDQVG